MKTSFEPAGPESRSGPAAVGGAMELEPTTEYTPTRKRRGRRPLHAERWTKATVVLMDSEIVFLDRLVADIRAANGAALSRAHLIRALIEALARSDVDLTACRSEQELTEAFAERFRPRSMKDENE